MVTTAGPQLWPSAAPGSQLWPPTQPRTLTRQVWNAETARSIPGMGRALGVYGMVASCALQHVVTAPGDPATPPAPRGLTRMLQRPDPDWALPTWLLVHIEDYLLHGNACHLITALDSTGYPAAVRWFPAHRWGVQEVDGQPVYTLDGRDVPRERVVHVRRGADPRMPWRGIGVVEQHLETLNRAGLESAAETAALTDRGMPAVVIIKPNGEADPVNDDKVASKWAERFSGQDPRPGIFPQGTVVTPLSWKPSDSQMVEARAMTQRDLASAMNLDPYWLGAEGSTMTYRTPGPMFLALLRTSLNPVMKTFEDQWSFSWLPYGRGVRFDRLELLRDDLASMVATFSAGIASKLFPDPNEARTYMGFPPLPESAWPKVPPQLDPPKPPADPADDDPADDPSDPSKEDAA